MKRKKKKTKEKYYEPDDPVFECGEMIAGMVLRQCPNECAQINAAIIALALIARAQEIPPIFVAESVMKHMKAIEEQIIPLLDDNGRYPHQRSPVSEN